MRINFKKFLKNNKKDLLAFLFLCFFAPLYFYNLNGYSLVDFDEAWFGEVAKNILKNSNPSILYFNSQPFLAHPPFGFILMAISIAIFGANEFAVRLPSALTGFLSLLIIYLIGKKLFNRTIGLGAALILTSCVWFVFRARTGNLDALLVFFFLLTFFFAINLKEKPKQIYLFATSLTALFLTKSFVGLTIIFPVIGYLLLNKVKIRLSKLLISFIIILLLISPWFFSNYKNYGFRFFVDLFKAGIRAEGVQKINFLQINKSQTATYLHYGIRKWYYPALISMAASLVFIKRSKNIISLYIWTGVLLFGFLTNKKTEIWHLLPIYPPLSLFISFFVHKFFSSFGKSFGPFALISIFIFSTFQIYKFKDEIKLFGSDVSHLAFTSKAAKNHEGKLYLDSDLTTPAVSAFYSDKIVHILKLQPAPNNTLPGIFQFGQRPFLLLTESWKLDLERIDKDEYQILSQQGENLLVKVI